MKKRAFLLVCLITAVLLTAVPVSAAEPETAVSETSETEAVPSGTSELSVMETSEISVAETDEISAADETDETDVLQPARPNPYDVDRVSVKSLKISRAGGGRYTARWELENVTEEVNVRLYAGQSRKRLSGNLLGSTQSGETGSLYITMPDVDSGYYIFYIVVTEPDGNVSYGFAEDAVYYDNTSRADAPDHVKACVNDSILYIINDDNTVLNVDFYDRETKAFLERRVVDLYPAEVRLDKPSSAYEVLVSDGTGSRAGRTINVSLPEKASAYHFIGSDKTVTNSPAFEFSLLPPCENSTVSAYEGNVKKTVSALDNGHYWVKLVEGKNTITFIAEDDAGRVYADKYTLVLDTEVPVISLNNGIDVINTEESVIYLEGTVSKDAKVICDGETMDMTGSCFIAKKILNYGSNEVEITAQDAAGNIGSVTVTVERTYWTGSLIKLIIVVGVAVLLFVGEIVILGMGIKERHERGN